MPGYYVHWPLKNKQPFYKLKNNSLKQFHNGKIICLPIHLQVSYKAARDPTSIQTEMV
jgi:hypothetical protein